MNIEDRTRRTERRPASRFSHRFEPTNKIELSFENSARTLHETHVVEKLSVAIFGVSIRCRSKVRNKFETKITFFNLQSTSGRPRLLPVELVFLSVDLKGFASTCSCLVCLLMQVDIAHLCMSISRLISDYTKQY